MFAETVEYKGHKIQVHYDDMAEDLNPRDTDYNLGTMVCYHRRYSLGDKMADENFPEPNDFAAWRKSQGKEVISLPVYMLDHSGICINTTGYSCPWDSGQVGWIYVTRKEAREKMGLTRITEKQQKNVLKWLDEEVEEYSQFLQGFVYYYDVYDENSDLINSCCGYIGEDLETNGLLESARSTINHNIADRVMSDNGKVVGTVQEVLNFFGAEEGTNG